MKERGFILPAVLAVVMLLAVVAAALDERVQQYHAAQADWARWVATQGELLDARSEVLLAMTTRMLSPLGFGAGTSLLRVDGRPYRLPSGVLVSVQDARGLISIASLDVEVLGNFLRQHGVADRDVEPLIDRLADYGDEDDLKRLNGAEKSEYAALGLPPPRNDWPVSPWELAQVAGWHRRPELWQRASDFFTASREADINPNTAPQEVLLALPGATREGVAALMRWREVQALDSIEAVAAVSGIRLAEHHAHFHPGLFYRVRLWRTDEGPGALEYNIMLTPNAPRLPWVILDARLVDRPSLDKNAVIEPFPLVDEMAASSAQRAPASP